MDAAPGPTPPSVPGPKPPGPLALLEAWPLPAQLATAVLVLFAAILLGIYAYGYLGGGSRPTEQIRSLDLNKASAVELRQIPGVGDKLAERIVEHRRQHGGFRRLEDLDQVPGVGAITVDRLRRWLYVDVIDEPEEEAYTPPRASVAGMAEQPSTAAAAKEYGSKKTAALSGRIDINRATVDELQKLPGIGPKLSQRIVEERARGPFKSVEDLGRVYGVGPKTIERLRPYITVDSQALRVVQQE